jgi:carboxymethylenebutenolidase
LRDGFFKYETVGGRAEAYVSNPRAGRPVGQVIVVHEVWGFTPFIRRVCERLSQAGFVAVAPLLYWRDKELFSLRTIREGLKLVWDLPLEDRYRAARLTAAIRERRPSREAASMLQVLYDRGFRKNVLQDLDSLSRSLKKESSRSRIAALGFSMGGKMAMQLAAGFPELRACAAYSAQPADRSTLERIRCPVMSFYGNKDTFMTGGLPKFVKDSMSSKTELTLKLYPGAGHEFFDDTSQEYREVAAKDAW